jgi:hypothetical protein
MVRMVEVFRKSSHTRTPRAIMQRLCKSRAQEGYLSSIVELTLNDVAAKLLLVAPVLRHLEED